MEDTRERSTSLVTPEKPETETTLFRPEVLTAAQSQWLGSVVITQGLTTRMFAVFAAATAAAVLCLLFFGEYTRKERVNGWIVPDRGLIRVFPAQPSVVTDVYVSDGDDVREGDVLMALSAELQSNALGATRRLAVLAERRNALAADLQIRDQELAAQRRRVELSAESRKRLEPLRERGLVATTRLDDLEGDRLERLTRLRELERDRAAAAFERATLEAEIRALPARQKAELAALERGAATPDQAFTRADAQREIVLIAPQSGVITAMQAELGGNANPGVPLVSIIPAGSVLEAELFIPTRARGFIRPGQRVRLRYQAFPYQRFGLFEGVVARISRSALAPSELTSQRASAMGAPGAQPELVYLVKVRIERQTVAAYGEEFPLLPGMQLEADVEIDKRRLFEWVLDPLYSVTGRTPG